MICCITCGSLSRFYYLLFSFLPRFFVFSIDSRMHLSCCPRSAPTKLSLNILTMSFFVMKESTIWCCYSEASILTSYDFDKVLFVVFRLSDNSRNLILILLLGFLNYCPLTCHLSANRPPRSEFILNHVLSSHPPSPFSLFPSCEEFTL